MGCLEHFLICIYISLAWWRASQRNVEGSLFIPHKTCAFGRKDTKVHVPTPRRSVLGDKPVLLLPGLLFNWFSIRARVYHISLEHYSGWKSSPSLEEKKTSKLIKETEEKFCIRLFRNSHHEKQSDLLLSNVSKIEGSGKIFFEKKKTVYVFFMLHKHSWMCFIWHLEKGW